MIEIKTIGRAALAALLLACGGGSAVAQDAGAPPGKYAGDFMIRLRGIGVIPADNADIDPIGGDTELSNTGMPEIDFTYFVTDNIAFELIAATTHHEVSARNTAAGDIDLGDVWVLPPTLLVQYHFLTKERFSPYIGAGINYTIFYGVDEARKSIAEDVDYDNSLGWALQIGIDYRLAEDWYINADVKRLFLDTDVSVNNGAVKADVDVDPWIFGMGVGYKF